MSYPDVAWERAMTVQEVMRSCGWRTCAGRFGSNPPGAEIS